MKLKFLLASLAVGALAAPAAVAHGHGHHGHGGYSRTETFWRDGCQITRTWFPNGRYRDERFCPDRGRRSYGSRHDDDYDDDRYGYGYGGRPGYGTAQIQVGRYFNDDHRYRVSNYYGRPCERYHDGHRRSYRVGNYYDPRWGWRRPHHDVVRLLPAAPRGYGYYAVDNDVLLVAEASRLIVDALVLANYRR